MTTELVVSPGQQVALDAIREWFEESDEQVFRMFGPAGTGKTTIARLVPELLGLDEWHYGAFSGKAAQVLRSKGCKPASTLHSLVYGAPINLVAEEKKIQMELEAIDWALESSDPTLDHPMESPGKRAAFLATVPREQLRGMQATVMEALLTNVALQRTNGPFLWPPKDDGELETTQLLIADEVSMVSDRMAEDILATGCRILVLGDPEQLPPVGGDGYFTRAEPDIMLTEVHRQALDSPVLALATRVRLGGWIQAEEFTGGKAVDYTTFDQILCWRRATRWAAINYVRNQLGRPAGVPVPGDKVMNLANNKDLSVFNGQTYVVDEVSEGREDGEYRFTLHEDGGDPITMFGYAYGFTQEGEKEAEKQRLGWRGDAALLTFSQALTVHKAQGSEWASVCVLDETRSMWSMDVRRAGYGKATENARRWLYTAITRASDTVTLIRK